MLKCTDKIFHDSSYMIRSTWTIIREPVPNLAKVTIFGEIISKNTPLNVQQCCGKNCFKLWCVLCAVQFMTTSHKLSVWCGAQLHTIPTT